MKKPSRKTDKPLVGVDLGGTNVRALVVGREGNVISRARAATDGGTQEGIIGGIAETVSRALSEASLSMEDVLGVGVGSPGPLNPDTGEVYDVTNIPGMKYLNLRELLEERLGVQVVVENDANAAAIAEHWVGAGVGTDHLVMFTLGTGVGGALIIGSRIVHGAAGSGGELGHITVRERGAVCGCGNRGCLETISSATGVVREARNAMLVGETPTLSEMTGHDPDKISAKIVADAARKGDVICQEIYEDVGRALGVVIASLVNAINPDIVVLGGGMREADDLILPNLHKELERRSFKEARECMTVVKATLGDDAGAIGAARALMLSISDMD